MREVMTDWGHADGHSGGFHFRAELLTFGIYLSSAAAEVKRRSGKVADGGCYWGRFLPSPPPKKPFYAEGVFLRPPPTTNNKEGGTGFFFYY